MHLGWIRPNTLTLVGIIPQALFFYFMNSHQFGWAAVALVFSIIDMLDGALARSQNRVTAFGGFLDSTLDRVADFLIIGGFYVAGLVNLPTTAILLCATFLISYTRSSAGLNSNGKIKFDQGLIQRPERIIFLFFVIILRIFFPTAAFQGLALSEILITILTILSVYTLGERIWYAYKKL